MNPITNDAELSDALGLSERATFDNWEKSIRAHVEQATTLHDPAFLPLLTGNVEAQLRERHGEDFDLLRPDAIERAKARAEEEWRAKGRQSHATADAALAYLRARTAAAINAQMTLKGESAQPHANRTERLLAALVDVQGEAAANAAIARLKPEQALNAYRATADEDDRPFVRTFEKRFAAGDLDLSAASHPIDLAREIREAIEARRTARVRQVDMDRLARLDALAVDVARTSGNLDRALSVAGKAGALPRPTRAKTNGHDGRMGA